jgi:plastocyanin
MTSFVHRSRRLALGAGLLFAALGLVAPVLAAGVSVSIDGKAFTPADIVVHQGDTVTWTVKKSIGEPHTVTSGKPADADKGAVFDSQQDDPGLAKLKDDGGSFSFTFDKSGTYSYFCVVHPVDMTGRVVVLAPGETPGAGAPGEAGPGIPVERRLIGAGILVVALAVLFGAASVWRRMNPA